MDVRKMLSEELADLEARSRKIRAAIKALGNTGPRRRSRSAVKRTMSAAGRERVRAAQKRRWAKYRAAKKKGK